MEGKHLSLWEEVLRNRKWITTLFRENIPNHVSQPLVVGPGMGEELLHLRRFLGNHATIHAFDKASGTQKTQLSIVSMLADVNISFFDGLDFTKLDQLLEQPLDFILCRHPDFKYKDFTSGFSYFDLAHLFRNVNDPIQHIYDLSTFFVQNNLRDKVSKSGFDRVLEKILQQKQSIPFLITTYIESEAAIVVAMLRFLGIEPQIKINTTDRLGSKVNDRVYYPDHVIITRQE